MNISLRRRHAQTVKIGASSHKTNHVGIFSEILNPEGHQNHCICPKITLVDRNNDEFPYRGFLLIHDLESLKKCQQS